ncbi:MAG: site-specific DNA-methyltransferase [Planctomycetes bacterium]|nr:site-specific DNA-methyltransferase [Planctomycetota bacterium]NOG55495.1 site-specific DNA-methyltransferase [Planctomycetota bacterium]
MPVLQFKGKTAVENHHWTVPHHTLEFDRKLSCLGKGEEPSLDGNLIIEGDNLLALKALLPTHAGKVKCIYIDPPYNTGNEGWIYNDNLTQPQFKEWIDKEVGKEGEDACRHDKWCCMMYPRLALLKELLHSDGVMLVSIDDHELQHLRMLMDELFGEENLVASLVWEKGRKNDARFWSVGHEYMFVYAKSKDGLKTKGVVWREPKPGAAELWDAYASLRNDIGADDAQVESALKEWFEEQPAKHPVKKLRRYLHVDQFGPWRDRDISWPGGGGPRYDVPHPETGKPCVVPDAGWRFAHREEMERQIEIGLVVFREDHTKPPFRKAHLRPIPDEVLDNGDSIEIGDEEPEELDIGMQVMGSYIYKQSQIAVRYLRKLMGKKVFPNPKDHEVLARLIRYCSPPNALVLDSFAGSGSTGQATLEANRLDGGSRQFILAQQRHDTKEDKNKGRNICKLAAERVKRAVKQEGYQSGSFTYARLSERPLFGEYKDFGEGELPSYEDIAKYVFYTETSQEFPGTTKKKNPAWDKKAGRIGEHGGRSYYLLYRPNHIIDWALDTVFLKEVAAKDGNHELVIYCEKVWLHREQLQQFEQEHGKKVRPMLVPFNLK